MRLDLRRWFPILIVVASLPVAMGHSGGCGCSGEEELFGPPTASVCPTASTLTYENFGQPFMATHCTRCHASTLSGPDRNGAPAFHDFDSLNGILAVAEHIDWTTGASADGLIVNDSMPEDGETAPTLVERQQLAEWLACELAR